MKNRPWSNVLADPPELFFANVKSGSSIVNVVLSMVVVVPFTVKLPVIVVAPATVNAELTATTPVPFGVSVMSPLVTCPVNVLAVFDSLVTPRSVVAVLKIAVWFPPVDLCEVCWIPLLKQQTEANRKS